FYPQLQALNVMRLHSPQSAILSAIIFNALIIVALIPLALKGVKYRPEGAGVVLRRNLLVYGLGGIVVPFIGIKAIDLVVTAFGLACGNCHATYPSRHHDDPVDDFDHRITLSLRLYRAAGAGCLATTC